MPIYEYVCDACGLEMEREQRISDAPLRTCPECRKPKLRRLISRTAFVLKGGGWYRDLYSSPKSGGASDKSEAKPKPSKESKKDSGSAPTPKGDGGGDKGKSRAQAAA